MKEKPLKTVKNRKNCGKLPNKLWKTRLVFHNEEFSTKKTQDFQIPPFSPPSLLILSPPIIPPYNTCMNCGLVLTPFFLCDIIKSPLRLERILPNVFCIHFNRPWRGDRFHVCICCANVKRNFFHRQRSRSGNDYWAWIYCPYRINAFDRLGAVPFHRRTCSGTCRQIIGTRSAGGFPFTPISTAISRRL